ncbi:MAG: AhpC/TSA family protein [Candidatus Wolfebacteria bacterium GW2011_GWE1_48_7]|uniref:AhpC/TSA family protein n=2 Tax=Candidatus Wolfeibacteriota TaxID=1752735 RepID=A0A0G1X5D9_9BACT|nr:MAG: thiol-disulfide isomerase [Candidatus Wolfebacteria bacterium GW2011_GWB1_47_1]KKU36765.1 MAG: AhpC/TSA family protein [Candidatus Wolfebacteria bacterium GW2011_GWC2_46_275]KKU42305.1 MAG: AhpC/TSA family protein [Candidatus Wolfebacteria bacterium GW2011_GWB2_46_69]KKU53689.1 MAG: AhpC/TSA family protein [Candidatus Wolfebacteria bacterium GW2011_GWC1_47_103]KKU58934.1 MAG: AhpC/TSA family protein [Candidatus Wolfebacteria bacterium GW2011_GWE2_47_12]KKU66102.1 MAG: AhpC/TSA family p
MQDNIRKTVLVLVVAMIVVAIGYFELQKPKRIGTTGTEIQVPAILTVSTITDEKPQQNATKTVTVSGLQAQEPTRSIDRSSIQKEKALKFDRLKELVNPGGFINGDSFRLADFAGKKVILIDFWTYSCINCQRTTPYLNAWYEKYKDQGLVIVGVHTPEFGFEKMYENVVKATRNAGIQYPVVQDNEYGTWNAYANRFWPRKYLIDIDGFIVYDHIGEGDYDGTERVIQKALKERQDAFDMSDSIAGGVVAPKEAVTMNMSGVKSPEVYFGAARNASLKNGKEGLRGLQILDTPEDSVLNRLYLGGSWYFDDEFARTESSGATIIYRYSAKNVYFVARADSDVVIKITRDGELLGIDAGKDVGADGVVRVKEDRLYELVNGTTYGEHVLEMEVQGPGLEAYTFTFG